MRARLHDPDGPAWVRFVLPALGLVCIGFGLYVRVVDGPGVGATFFVGFAVALLAPLLVSRHRPRNATVVASAGAIHVRDAGVLRQTIRAHDITGAFMSTAPGGEGVSLVMALRGRAGAPVVLELANDRDAGTVRDALGIGPRGFGVVSWRAAPSGLATIDTAVRALGALWALVLAGHAFLAGPDASPDTLLGILLVSVVTTLVLALAMHARLTRLHGCLTLTESEVRVPFGAGAYRVPYASIVAANLVPDGIRLVREPANLTVFAAIERVAYARGGMTDPERAHAVLHIEAAAFRAQNEGGARELSAADALGRRPNEGNHAWLARLDAAARVLGTGAVGGYRGSALSVVDLWAALEDDDAHAHVRAAAARVLCLTAHDGVRARVDSTLGRVRDDSAAKRIRVAMEPDLEVASRELEALEQGVAPPPVSS